MRSILVSGAREWKEVLELNTHQKMSKKLVYSERWGKTMKERKIELLMLEEQVSDLEKKPIILSS